MYKVLIVLSLFIFYPAWSVEQQIKINVDTISYMGCSNPSSFPGLSGFRLGAYSEGLQLTDEFQKIVKEYDADQKEAIFKDSSVIIHQGQVLKGSEMTRRGRVNISTTADVRRVLYIGGQPIIGLFPTVKNPLTIEKLIEKGVIHSVGIDHPIEAKLTIPGSILGQVLHYLGIDYHITLTYDNGLSDQPLGPASDKYYGRSYQVGFDENHKYLAGITEYDLSTGNTVKEWSCANGARFMVLRSEEERWFDPRGVAAEQEAVCVEDDNALISFISGKQSLERLFPKALIAVGFVHTWKEKDEKDLSKTELIHRDRLVKKQGEEKVWVLERTDTPCITNRHSDVQCYSQTASIQWEESECEAKGYHNRCPVYLSFCTAG